MRRHEAGLRHVLMTADTVGGVWTYALRLAESLVRRGIRTTLATMGRGLRPEQRAAASRVTDLHVEESDYALEWMDDPWDDVDAAGDWLLSLERRFRPDVVHLNGYAHGALPFRAPRVVVAHSCVLSWWRAVLGEDAPPRYARYQRAVATGLARADAVVAPTRAMLRAVDAHYGPAGPDRVRTVIANGIDVGPRRVGPKEPLVLAAGRVWDQAKNIAAVDAVAPRLSWPVVVAGSATDPEGRGRTLSACRALGWLGEEALAEWMARASIFVHPARYEPFGLAPLEAAAHGCALVLGDIESLREVWGDEGAEYVPPDDPGALAAAVERLAANPGLRARRAAQAHARALSLSADRMGERYDALYRRLAVRRHPNHSLVPCT